MKTKPIIAASIASILALGGAAAGAAPAQAAGKNYTGYVATGHGRATVTYVNFKTKTLVKHVSLPYTVKLSKHHVSGGKFFTIIVTPRDSKGSDKTGCKVVKNGHVLKSVKPNKSGSATCTVYSTDN